MWVRGCREFLDEATAFFEKQLGQSAVHSKPDRAAGPLCEDFFAPVLGDVEGGELLGTEHAGDEAGEVADLYQELTGRLDDKAGHAPRYVSVHLWAADRNLRAAKRSILIGFPYSGWFEYLWSFEARKAMCRGSSSGSSFARRVTASHSGLPVSLKASF